MAGDCVPCEGPDLKKMGEEELWELINDNRHRISLGVRPCILIPYLRQARVLTEMDEDEIISCHNLTNRCMRTSYMLDLLRTQGRNGAVALLESLMIHYPTLYTQVTGRKPSTEPSRFSGLIKYSELTEYLVRAVTGMQKELQEARREAGRMTARCTSLESEIRQITEQEEKSRRLQDESERMRRHLCSLQCEVTKLKDEKCDLYVRYTTAIEEKSAVNKHLHDLNLQVYQLQTELQKVQLENKLQKQCSLRRASFANTPQLQEEVQRLRCQLVKAEKLDPAHQDILAQDLAEAIDSQVELAAQLRCYREENEQLHIEKQGLMDQKEGLSLQVQQLTLDCKIHQQKTTMIHNQLRELQAERDQAYQSRDEAQAMIARILAEKDTLRCQLVELQERAFSLQTKQRAIEQQQQSSEEAEVDWESLRSSSEESSNRRRLCRMDAINPMSLSSCQSESEDIAASSVRSRTAEPPSSDSLRRREETLHADSSFETVESDSLLDDFVFLPNMGSKDMLTQRLCSSNGSTSDGLSATSVPPFLMRSRPKAIRISGRAISISFQGEALLSQLVVVGGNKTGVFVHKVTEGSTAHTVGISPGAQIVEVKYEQNQKALRMVLEDSTLEEAMWALGQVTGLCHLSLRPRQDEYEALLQQLQNSEISSGDSFYVRVNMSLPAGPNGTLAVSCNNILHVTNTRPTGSEDTWQARQVHPCQLLDLQSGTVPNYYRAQRLLIRAIEEMSFQTKKSLKVGRVVAQNKEKAVRIVSTGRQGRNPMWVSVEDENSADTSAPKSCVSLMPYTLVTPHYPPVCRPVLLLPTVLGRILDKKLAGWKGFQLCEPETLSSCEHAARLQRSEILEECEQGQNHCYTLQSVEKVMKKGIHCVLPLGLDCVRRLHRADIFPIIIFIGQSARSTRKLRSKLQRHGQSEEQLLACSRSEEPLLDKLPCLYRSVASDSWCDQTSLLTSLRRVLEALIKKVTVCCIHGKMKSKRNTIFADFRALKSGILVCTDVMARGIDIPDVNWVLQYDPPSSARAFVHRCGRTARIGNQGNALVFLLPMEETYVTFLSLNQQCPLQIMPPIRDVVDVLPKVKAMSLADRAMFDRGMRAFVSYIQAYAKHECSLIFRIKDLDFASLARGFALLRLPKMPELRGKTFPDFIETTVDTETIRYKDKQRQKLRQKMLKERAENPPPKRIFVKNNSWSKQKTKKERKKKWSAKRKRNEESEVDNEEMKELLDDTRLLKKLKRGKISEEDFEKQITSKPKSKHKTEGPPLDGSEAKDV